MGFSEHALTDATLCVATRRFSFSQMCRKGQTSARRQYIVVNLHPYIGLRGHIMFRLRRYFNSLVLAAALLTSAASVVQARNQGDRHSENDHVRYYDRDHGDYHNWDDREDRAYRRYLVAKHRVYNKFNRANTRAHRDYWNWRHNNPDRD